MAANETTTQRGGGLIGWLLGALILTMIVAVFAKAGPDMIDMGRYFLGVPPLFAPTVAPTAAPALRPTTAPRPVYVPPAAPAPAPAPPAALPQPVVVPVAPEPLPTVTAAPIMRGGPNTSSGGYWAAPPAGSGSASIGPAAPPEKGGLPESSGSLGGMPAQQGPARVEGTASGQVGP